MLSLLLLTYSKSMLMFIYRCARLSVCPHLLLLIACILLECQFFSDELRQRIYRKTSIKRRVPNYQGPCSNKCRVSIKRRVSNKCRGLLAIPSCQSRPYQPYTVVRHSYPQHLVLTQIIRFF